MRTVTSSVEVDPGEAMSLIRCVSAFAALSEASLENLAELATLRRVRKGVFILRQGDEMHWYYAVLKGMVRVIKHSSDGRVFTFEFTRAGGTLGDISLFCAEPPRSPVSAQTAEETLLAVFDRNDILSFAMQNPAMAARIGENLARRLFRAGNSVSELLGDEAQLRVIKTLVALCSDFGAIIPLTHQQIADMSGVSRETASRILERLDNYGTIRLLRKKVGILDKDKLICATLAAGA